MTRLFQDVETFSELDLTKVGVSRYARHPSTEIVMLAYAFDDGPIKQFDALTAIGPRGEHSSNYYRSAWMDAAPADWREAMDDPRVDKSGWNVGQFERVVFNHVLGLSIPPDEWRDTMVLALTCSFPGKLDHALKAAGFPAEDQKLASGKALMRYFSQPRKPTKTMARTRNMPADAPDKWLAYLEYNRHDVHAERAFYQRFRDFDLPYWEWELWQLDQKINDRGIPVNLDMVDNAIELAARITKDRMKTMREITGLDNPNSGDQLLPWLRAGGYPFVDLKKGHIARAIDERLVGDDLTLEVLELRRETAKTSVKKFDALALATDDDGYLRYTLQFAAAGRTWRWGGRKFQPQNLARPHKLLAKRMVEIARDIEVMGWEEFDRKYVDPKTKQALSMDALSTGVRPAVQAPDGYVFVEADLKAIENIGLGWMFKDRKILSVFENNRDPYIDFATYMYNLPYDELWAEYKGGDWHKRQICKPGVLGCGYGLSEGDEYEDHQTGEIEATGLLGYAWNMGIREFTKEDSAHSVKTWRKTFKTAVNGWYELHGAMFECVATGRPQGHGPIGFRMKGEFLLMELPSGRDLKYHRPLIKRTQMPWGAWRDSITYMSLDERNQWVRISTHPGKVTENGDQAICRDILAKGIVRAEKEGIPVRLHVHDSILGLAKERDADRQLKLLTECMTAPISWAPKFPIRAEGHATKLFVKD